MSNIRTRFAPSPTGFLHVGGIRTALFAFLLARRQGGQFVLRLEDTDKQREVAGSEDHLIKSLHALGLKYDEGPDIGGLYGPYRQSERLTRYADWAQRLIAAGRAYADPYSPAQIDEFRQQSRDEKRPFLYRNHRPDILPTWDGSQPLRFLSDPQAYTWDDAVMGTLSTGPEVIDDFILIKSDGYPTYNFAHIVDDADMAISHILRGQEFLASTPNYLNLYEALGIQRPVLATMPPVLAAAGTKKLSKRDGAKDVLDYLRDGYAPEALLNFIATLGWNDGTEQELFTMDELIQKFSLERVGSGGARFDEQRLSWINGSFIRGLSSDELFDRCAGFWPEEASDASVEYKRQILGLIQERMKYFGELPELSRLFFSDIPTDATLIDNHKQLKKYDKARLWQLLEATIVHLEDSDFSTSDIQARLNEVLAQSGEKPVVLFSLIRIASTQSPSSPGLADTLAVLGKEVSLRRLKSQLSSL